MLEIIYRIYEIPTEEEKQKIIKEYQDGDRYYDSDMKFRKELAMDIMVCESRDSFKEMIKDIYGQELTFQRPRNPIGGEIYCIIIGDNAWEDTKQRMFSRTEFVCEFCKKTVKGFITDRTKLENGSIKHDLLGQYDKYAHLNFCSYSCKNRFIDVERMNYTDEQIAGGAFVTKDSFSNSVTGYIYKITKKSTRQFYIGQTIYAPVFRWGQHLKTNRFKIENITDYLFEVIEIVESGENILDREAYHIQSMYQKYPELSLNEINTKNTNALQIKMEDL